jgi:DNA repair protein RecO (recombination protein O)
MQILTGEAILLEVRELHEHDRIVTFLSRDAGKKRGVARGSRRKYSRFAGQLQPLATCRVSWFEKAGAELVRITDVDLLRPASALQSDLEGILLGSYLADQMDAFAPEAEVDDARYRLLDSTLSALLSGVDRDLAARYYEAWILRLSGIFPAPGECPSCGRDLGSGGGVLPSSGEGLICRTCAAATGSGRRVSPEALQFLLRMGRESLPRMASRGVPGDVLRELEEVNAVVRRNFLQRELRSYDVMKKTLSSV